MQQFLSKHLARFRRKPAAAKELEQQRISQIEESIGRVMDEQKPFLRYGYSLNDLSRDTHIPSYQLSAFLNREMGLNFNTFLNHYRVWHCEGLIQQGLTGNENLQVLAQQCGFGNRNSLTTAFKKFTGFTPSRYQRGWARLLDFENNDQ